MSLTKSGSGTPGGDWPGLENLCAVTARKGHFRHLVGRGWGTTKQPMTHRMSPLKAECSCPEGHSTEVEVV